MKITIEYDTMTKKLVVKQDGTVMERVSSVNFYNWNCCEEESEAYMEIRQSSDEHKENGIFTTITTTAEDSRKSIAEVVGL